MYKERCVTGPVTVVRLSIYGWFVERTGLGSNMR